MTLPYVEQDTESLCFVFYYDFFLRLQMRKLLWTLQPSILTML